MANRPTKKQFPIVCIGASAGGLEALIPLFKSLPKYINMAFVVVLHLEPTHESILAEILSRGTSLNIQQAKKNVKVKPGNIYVIQPNCYLSIFHRTLKVTSRTRHPDGKYLPIDFFMNSLASDQGKNAIGVILSGTGSDGTLGIKAIKDKGGSSFAQNKNTAKYYDMPAAAIASGSIDHVLEPTAISEKLIEIATHKYRMTLARKTMPRINREDALDMLLILLRNLSGVDFIHYKRASIERRIMRRMGFLRIKSHSDYYNYLKKNTAEAQALYKDILIPVTMFFRDPGIFTAIRKKLLPYITKKRLPKDPIRVWVTACSTGEEVYSIAITIYEFLEENGIEPHFQVFGTDISDILIEKARSGFYPADISAHVSAARLRRFFIKTETGYKIAKHIRDMCIFAKQDITNDTPLSNMDIISCRNLLIYLDTFLQSKVLSVLHYALKPKGFLILGSAESVTSSGDLFTVINKKYKFYSKNIIARRPILDNDMSVLKSKRVLGNGARTVKKAAVISRTGKALSGKSAIKSVITKYLVSKSEKSVMGKTGYEKQDFTKLEKELIDTKSHLHGIIEEKDTLNEELKAANEEIQSSNEELQSTNEELETSKEELQSTNEELLTVNEELQNKNAQLTQLNSDLANVLTSVNIPLIIVRSDLRIMRFTPMSRKVMNLIPTDIGRPIGDIKLNIDIGNLEGMILDVIEDMAPKELEVKDKENRWYSVRIRPYRTIDNKIDGVVIALIDIDIIKRSREEVRGALDYAEAIIETMREPLVVLDKDLRVLSVNKSFYSTFKVGVSEVKDKLLYELGGGQWDNPKLRKLLIEILRKKSYFNDFEVSFDFPDIGKRTMILNARQIKLHGKDSSLILLAIEEITKRKKAEDILKRDNITLDRMVNKRSRELLRLQVELVRSRHLSVVGTLAATVAHELRNPLTDIAVSIHRIKKISKDPVVEQILTSINKRITESDQIISNILMYSKKPITRYEFVKINDILSGSTNEVVQKYPERKISINKKIDPTKDLSIEIDPTRIKEVFSNVLHNAFEAVHADSGVIEIGSKIHDSEVSIMIKDNGIGIAKKDLKNISNPFFTTKAKGTGLGLAVCKQVVILHGGSITFDSAEGKGTTVTITLPINKVER